jgi:hypothetical protein
MLNSMSIARALPSALLLALGAPALGQEILGYAGYIHTDEPSAGAGGWAISYFHGLGPHLSASLSWHNEGHVPAHHRDGHSAQIWVRTPDKASGFSAAAHGWGLAYSLLLRWNRPESRWFYALRVDRVATRHSLDTTSLSAGLGYRLEQDGAGFYRDAMGGGAPIPRNELALLVGQTIVNSFESETSSLARSLEYRHAFGPYAARSHGSTRATHASCAGAAWSSSYGSSRDSKATGSPSAPAPEPTSHSTNTAMTSTAGSPRES